MCTCKSDHSCCRHVQTISKLDGAVKDALVQAIKQGKHVQQEYNLNNAPDAKVVRGKAGCMLHVCSSL